MRQSGAIAVWLAVIATSMLVFSPAPAGAQTSIHTNPGIQPLLKLAPSANIQLQLSEAAVKLSNQRLVRALKKVARAAKARHDRWLKQRRAARSRAAAKSAARASAASVGGYPPPPAYIAQCESGGDPTAVSPSGEYRGKWQFDLGTWHANGGTGDPAAAPEAVQDAVAGRLYAARGTAPWPVCG